MDRTSASKAAPVSAGDRIRSLDLLRGVAVLGILLMNITGFGLLPAAYSNPTVAGGAEGLNLAAWLTTTMAFEGTMRGLFSMLFGASIVLLTARMSDAGAGLETAEIYFRRMVWMMVFGIVHWALLLWWGEILFAYSLCGLLLFALRNLPPRLQIGAALALLTISVGFNAIDYRAALREQAAASERRASAAPASLPKETIALAKAWETREAHHKPTPEQARDTIALHRGGYLGAVRKQWAFSYAFQWIGLPYWAVFDMIPFMLLGMGLLRLGVLSGQRPVRDYALMAVAGYAIGVPLNWVEASHEMASGHSVLAAARSTISYEISRLAMVVGHLGILLSLVRSGVLLRVQARLAAVGQMALSNYLAQTLICTFVFFGFGLDQFMRLERHQLYFVVLAIWIAELVWSPIWLARFRFGPFEWLWRSLTYAKPQPMRRVTRVDAALEAA